MSDEILVAGLRIAHHILAGVLLERIMSPFLLPVLTPPLRNPPANVPRSQAREPGEAGVDGAGLDRPFSPEAPWSANVLAFTHTRILVHFANGADASERRLSDGIIMKC